VLAGGDGQRQPIEHTCPAEHNRRVVEFEQDR
jgi:hypothetical protein